MPCPAWRAAATAAAPNAPTVTGIWLPGVTPLNQTCPLPPAPPPPPPTLAVQLPPAAPPPITVARSRVTVFGTMKVAFDENACTNANPGVRSGSFHGVKRVVCAVKMLP